MYWRGIEDLVVIMGLMMLIGLAILIPTHSYAREILDVGDCSRVCWDRNFNCRLDCAIKFTSQEDDDPMWYDRIKCYANCSKSLGNCVTACSAMRDETDDITEPGHPAELEFQCYKACRKAGLSMQQCVKKCGEPF